MNIYLFKNLIEIENTPFSIQKVEFDFQNASSTISE